MKKHILLSSTLWLSLLLANSVGAQTTTNDFYVASFATGRLARLDGSTGAPVFDVPLSGAVTYVVRRGNALYVTTHYSSSVLQVDGETGASLGVFASGGGLATATGLAFGPDGNLYVASQSNSSVIRYDGSTGSFIDAFVPSGSGGLNATEAVLFGPDGNLYVTEFSGSRVLRYDGVTGAFRGEFASAPTLLWARSMVFGPDGNLYVAGNQSNNVVRFNGVTGVFIDVFASGIPGANGMVFGPDGNLYVAAEAAGRVMRFDGATGTFIDNFGLVTSPVGMIFDVGIINTVAGGGNPSPGFCGDGGPATSACFFYPIGVGVDPSGNVYIADDFNHRLRKVDAATGTIDTVVGGGAPTPGFCGDGGPATGACLNQPLAMAMDASGNFFVADYGNNRIRRVDATTGTITTMAGNGISTFCGDGGPATSACLNPVGIAFDTSGYLFVADYGNHRIRRIDTATGTITTFAGNGTAAFCGDGGPASGACLNNPHSVALDASGNLLIADRSNNRIRRVDRASGTITTVVGNGTAAFCGDGSSAASACLNFPSWVDVDGNGNLSIADRANHRIRRVSATTGVIRTVVGGGAPTPGFCGDGGPATRACLFNPTGLAVDPFSGRLLVADTDNQHVRVLP